MFKLLNIDGGRRMKFRLVPAVGAFCVPILLVFAARGDILLKGKTPVDRGRGDTVGGEIRWTSCDGARSTMKKPPYTVYKRDTECHGLEAESRTGIDDDGLHPSVFGLTCHGEGSVVGRTSRVCRVSDEKLARYFFNAVRSGDQIRYDVNGKQVTLTFGDEKLLVDKSVWRGKSRSSDLQ
jgi:hypothetical protein